MHFFQRQELAEIWSILVRTNTIQKTAIHGELRVRNLLIPVLSTQIRKKLSHGVTITRFA